MDHIFYLRLENDVCSAKVTAIDHPYQQVYHVLFDDGYENIFFTDVETGNWIEEDLGETALAASFGTKLYLLEGRYSIQERNKPLAWCKHPQRIKRCVLDFTVIRKVQIQFSRCTVTIGNFYMCSAARGMIGKLPMPTV